MRNIKDLWEILSARKMCAQIDQRPIAIKTIFSIFIGIAAVSVAQKASAHPHVWVSVKSEVLYNKEGKASGVRQRWKFDEFYSSFATQGLDKNGDGKFDRQELAELAEVNVSSLNEFDYFTFPKFDNKELAREEPKDYWLEHSDGVLTLHFTLPLAKPVDPAAGAFSFAVYDPTFYIAFEFAKERPLMLAAGAPKNCMAKLITPKQQEQKTASLSEAFFSEAGNALGIAMQLAQDAVVTCKN